MLANKSRGVKTKKIAIFVLDITLKGGIERFIANLSQIFEMALIEVTIYSLHKTFDEPLYKLPNNSKIIYLTNYKFMKYIYKFTTLYACFKLYFVESLKESELTAISTHPIISIYLYFINKRILNKTIASEHSSYGVHNIIVRALRILAYKKVKSVVTQTSSGVLEFEKFGIKTYKIPNSCTEFGDDYQWQKKTTNLNKSLICLTVARLDPVKQLDHFIEVAKIINKRFKNKEIIFQIVGSGPLKSKLDLNITKNGIGEIIKIYSSSKEINKYYKNADIYIICSKSEAFPMTMLEAMSYSLPVLSYEKLIGPKEILIDGKNGYLIKQDSTIDMANKITEIYNKKLNLAELANGALKSSKDFQEKTISSKWYSIV